MKLITTGILISFFGISITVCTIESCMPLALFGCFLGAIGVIVYRVGEEHINN